MDGILYRAAECNAAGRSVCPCFSQCAFPRGSATIDFLLKRKKRRIAGSDLYYRVLERANRQYCS
ncbi:MAG: hypothetical protein ACLTS6_13640 [Anaerobutyricum sp.]